MPQLAELVRVLRGEASDQSAQRTPVTCSSSARRLATFEACTCSVKSTVATSSRPSAALRELELRDRATEALERGEHRRCALPAGQLDDESLLVGRPHSRHHPVRDDAERPQRDERRDGRDERRLPVAGARRHADPGDEPERRRRRQAAHGETLTDDRARAEEADPGDDLGRDPCRVEDDPVALGEVPVRPRVRGDEEEERGAERDEQVGAKPRLALAKLPLETDRTAERSRDEQPDRDVDPRELRQRRPPVPARSPRSLPTRDRAARRAPRG